MPDRVDPSAGQEQRGGLVAGAVFAGQYRIIEAIGSGAAAIVYRAHDLKHDRDVALKVLREELTQSLSAERFMREIGIAAKLTHPHILPLHDSGEADGKFFYVTPFIQGESLRQTLDREGKLPLREAVAIARAVASALEYAHAQGIIHRDIKPENILLTSGQPLVADFGVARVLEVSGGERVTVTGLVVGTPAYMSPEQAVGDSGIDARSDLYSLGCVLFEMLTGESPFAGVTLQTVMISRLTSEARDVRECRGEVPRQLAELLSSMLARLPDQRVQTAAALRELLSAVEAECAAAGGHTYSRVAARTLAIARRRALANRIGLAAATAVLALLVGGWFARDSLPFINTIGDPEIKTIAVLPLANLSGDVQQEFFADGLTEALIADLSQLRGINVISRTSVMQYKMMRKPMREIARELKADALLEGALMREGDRVRITAKLARGSDEQVLWTASYDGRVGDLFSMQRQVGFAVAREIGSRFATRGAAREVVIKPESQQAYFKGSYYAGQWRLNEAIASYQKAVEVDPANAAAYAALARAYYFRTFFGEVAPREAFSQMRRAAEAALAQDPEIGEAHGLMALVHTHFTYDWAAAEQHFARALQLSPSNAQVHHDYAHFLLALGRGPESVEETRRAVELDPANPMLTSCLGWHSLFDDRFDQSLQHAAEAQRMMPNFWALVIQGWAHSALGHGDAALESMQDAVALEPELPFAQAAHAHMLARHGKVSEARAILKVLLARADSGYVPAYDLAIVYSGLRDSDRAFEWLAKAIAERSMFAVHLNWDMRLQELREDKRFGDLVRRLDLPAANPRPVAPRAGAIS